MGLFDSHTRSRQAWLQAISPLSICHLHESLWQQVGILVGFFFQGFLPEARFREGVPAPGAPLRGVPLAARCRPCQPNQRSAQRQPTASSASPQPRLAQPRTLPLQLGLSTLPSPRLPCAEARSSEVLTTFKLPDHGFARMPSKSVQGISSPRVFAVATDSKPVQGLSWG